ncbi:MAG: peptidoglycan DD-metalloendopeptidase family protein, partial [Propionibacteriaceae bacterium]|nr:peptidoglycan DD-metalloendopeptidase family protein [Propionibacteriaceae bacterium]
MKFRGITSVLAAGIAVALVWMVGASGEEAPLEAVPVAAQAPPAPGPDRALDSVREAFGDELVDPLGSDVLSTSEYGAPAPDFQVFDPYNAPTPEVIQPDGSTDAAVVIPLPTAPATIATSTVEAVGKVEAGALLSMPVKGRATSKFGMRFHPVIRVYKLHTGHDWAAPCGTPVGAAAPGTVVQTGWAGGNGVQVKIDHGMLKGHRVVTTYNHLSSIGVKVGQKVTALQGVGRVGNTGYSTGCHLHFEVIVNGQFTDPIPWLNGEPTVVDFSQMDNVLIPTLPSSSAPTLTESGQPLLPSLPGSPLPSASESPFPSWSPSDSPTASPSETDTEQPPTQEPGSTPSETDPVDPWTPSDPPSGTEPGTPTETTEPSPEPTTPSPEPSKPTPEPTKPTADPATPSSEPTKPSSEP